jgi:hypothetical protein
MDNKNFKSDPIDDFIKGVTKPSDTLECKDDVCIIKNDKSLIEVIGRKKIITDDGRQLLT